MATQVLAAAQRWLLGLMMACYVLAGVFPGPGEWLRGLTLRLPVGGAVLPLPALLLAVMLVNAGLGARVRDLGTALRRPLRLAVGVVANALLPAVVLPAVALCLRSWPDPQEVEALLVGLMLVLAMPVAGGAATWGQQAGGNVPLAVAMVMGSTLLSPFTVPLGLRLTGFLVGPGGIGGLDDTARLDKIAGAGVGTFALASVVLPALVGIALRTLLGERRIAPLMPSVKAVNLVNILLLCYINAAGALGRAVAHPDPDLFVLALGMSGVVCCLSFLLGRWMSVWTRCESPDSVSLTFAAGMNNSSAAAVLAAVWFSHRPEVLLPVLAYSLLQKVTAGAVGGRLSSEGGVVDRSAREAGPVPAGTREGR
ncbi:bile acid:sodium symporter family protein [Streptosporangium nondiastaticum]|uniref:bile acid:sodium symporter family protein n=1 Tax=Streptosporangium nondiastaticum TaxID=35764 RepID=UPI0011B23B43|nr:bile acid:sodium symporter [Streptosporangium nondiastaticum]